MIVGDKPVMVFSEKEKSLYITIHKKPGRMIDLVILNGMAEPVIKMKLISGSHRIDLASLQQEEYMIKLVAGDNVWLQKITIKHQA
jgi:hypothetical protein